MARLARVVAVGEPHHLTQRGNNRQPTFLDDHDRHTYCRLLAGQCAREGVRLLGYCLMPNHVHMWVSGRSVRFCTLSGAFLMSVEVPIERRAVDTKLLRHLTC